MQPSLSLILPAFNAERTLATQVRYLLELLGELTNQFEILVIDDGSTDLTCLVADELAREYPQVRVLSHATRMGMAGLERTARERSAGQTIILALPGQQVQSSELQQLWRESHTTPGASSRSLLGKLAHWGSGVTKESRTLRSVRLLERSASSHSSDSKANSSGIRRPASFTAHLRELSVGHS